MRLIFSRKGFDSSAGGKPSPILPDGRMVSLPIPDKRSSIRYADIQWHEYNVGSLVSDLTGGQVPATYRAHLDPDLSHDSLPRLPEWRPIFGQTGPAQGHLRRNGVEEGDVFLFFGLFRHVARKQGRFQWDTASMPLHVLWGWLQVGEILKVDACDMTNYEWAGYHPHFHRGWDKNNTVYFSRTSLELAGAGTEEIAGAGVFPCFSERLQLTAPSAKSVSQWELPMWFYPRNGKSPLTYHNDLTRWQRTDRRTRLNTVARGQEFILNGENYPEAIEWFADLMKGPRQVPPTDGTTVGG